MVAFELRFQVRTRAHESRYDREYVNAETRLARVQSF